MAKPEYYSGGGETDSGMGAVSVRWWRGMRTISSRLARSQPISETSAMKAPIT